MTALPPSDGGFTRLVPGDLVTAERSQRLILSASAPVRAACSALVADALGVTVTSTASSASALSTLRIRLATLLADCELSDAAM